jgi:hypothetical protein
MTMRVDDAKHQSTVLTKPAAMCNSSARSCCLCCCTLHCCASCCLGWIPLVLYGGCKVSAAAFAMLDVRSAVVAVSCLRWCCCYYYYCRGLLLSVQPLSDSALTAGRRRHCCSGVSWAWRTAGQGRGCKGRCGGGMWVCCVHLQCTLHGQLGSGYVWGTGEVAPGQPSESRSKKYSCR